jgi:hypothetical protein
LKQPDLFAQVPHHMQFSYVQSVKSLYMWLPAQGCFTSQHDHHAATARKNGYDTFFRNVSLRVYLPEYK